MTLPKVELATLKALLLVDFGPTTITYDFEKLTDKSRFPINKTYLAKSRFNPWAVRAISTQSSAYNKPVKQDGIYLQL